MFKNDKKDDLGVKGSLQERASRILDELDFKDRLRSTGRRPPNLVVVLLPLWIWVLGLTFIPASAPLFGRAMFHASCLAGFGWMLWQCQKAWSVSRLDRKSTIRQKKQQEMEELIRRRKEKNI